MAEDGLFFRWCAEVHRRFRTPHVSLIWQAVWSIALVAVGRYDQLFTYVIFVSWIFYALAVLVVILLRHTRPELPRPYPVFGYPLVPLIFLVTALWFVVNTLIEKPLESGLGVLIVILGSPVFWFWRRRSAIREH